MVHFGSMPALRTTLLLVIALNLVMDGIRVFLDPQLLGMPGGLQSALEPAALLTLNGLIQFLAVVLGPAATGAAERRVA